MLTARRSLIVASCLALVVAVGCSGGPTAPSGMDGATVAGNVNVNGAAALAPGATNSAAASGLTVTIVGTNLSAVVEASGYFQINGVPSGNVGLQFKDAVVNATAQLSNVGDEELIEIEVQVSGTTATIVSEVRTNEKVSLCHNTGTGVYHMINVSVNAEPAHRAHGDGEVGDPVPAAPTQVFDESCRVTGPAIDIEKSTNGEDADQAPGPKVLIGSQVNWQYVVTNTGTIDLTNVQVVDDQGVAVSCPATTLGVGQSMTCTASGLATAGQYRNVGTVTASSASGPVTDSDASHYFGQAEDEEEEGPKVQLCHRTGNGRYVLIEVSINAEPAHRAHGDGKIGEPVPGQPGMVFGPGCTVS
jgi:hypothetical protein